MHRRRGSGTLGVRACGKRIPATTRNAAETKKAAIFWEASAAGKMETYQLGNLLLEGSTDSIQSGAEWNGIRGQRDLSDLLCEAGQVGLGLLLEQIPVQKLINRLGIVDTIDNSKLIKLDEAGLELVDGSSGGGSLSLLQLGPVLWNRLLRKLGDDRPESLADGSNDTGGHFVHETNALTSVRKGFFFGADDEHAPREGLYSELGQRKQSRCESII
jgi:hypothetical protein